MRRKRQKYKEPSFPAPPVSRRTPGWSLHVWAGVVLIAVITFLVYLPSLQSGFILDDDKLVTDNETIMAPDGIRRFWLTTEPYDYWPVTNTMLWIEWRLWRMNPIGYRTVNLVLHVAAALLIWMILRKLALPGAFLAALIFAVHPVNVESVAWIAQRKNMLAIVFFLLSVLWYLKSEMNIEGRRSKVEGRSMQSDLRSSTLDPRLSNFNVRWYWLSLLAFVLAMLSKGSVAMLPVLLLGITWWRRKLTWRDLVWTAPFFAVAAALVIVNIYFQRHYGTTIRDADLLERILGAGAVIWFYLSKAILPLHLLFIYPLWKIQATNPWWWAPLTAAVALTAVLWWYRNGWSRPSLFAWGFFCVSLVPVMGLTDVGFMKHSLVADHYQHIAIIGVIALAAAGWSVLHSRLRVAQESQISDPSLFAVTGTAAGGSANVQAGDPSAAKVFAPESPARALPPAQGRLLAFLTPKKQWATYAVAALVVSTLAALSWRQNACYQDTIALYRKTLQNNPNCWLIHNNLGILLFNAAEMEQASGNPEAAARYFEEAIGHYQKTIQLNPEFSEAYNNLGNALGEIGRLPEAVQSYEKALTVLVFNSPTPPHRENIAQIKYNPDRFSPPEKKNIAQIENNLGFTLARLGRFPEAIDHYRKAQRLQPHLLKILNNLGLALLQSGRAAEAVEPFRQVCNLTPFDPLSRRQLGVAYYTAGQYPQAIEAFEQTISLQPNSPDDYGNLALAYAAAGRSSEAVAAAQKGLSLARSAGRTDLARHIEGWLTSFQARPEKPRGATP
jgi:tetratricopeptide (TPR) repeat protein